MYSHSEIKASGTNPAEFAIKKSETAMVEELRSEQQTEVMDFLRERPLHTFGMAGFIRRNGLVSPHNRGRFYACRAEDGRLQGVALIGHYILFEARCDAAVQAFARLAQDCRTAHMLLGEQDEIEAFWRYYAEQGQEPRRFCRELLFEQTWPMELRDAVSGLRLASLDDLELIVPAHAQLAFEESGTDPLATYPDDFRERCARRINEGQTWVWVENRKLMFKADVIADTAEVVYLEGIWVDSDERGNGHGLNCLSQLSAELLMRTRSICLLVNERLDAAQRFYRKAGFKLTGNYDTIFLKKQNPW